MKDFFIDLKVNEIIDKEDDRSYSDYSKIEGIYYKMIILRKIFTKKF